MAVDREFERLIETFKALSAVPMMERTEEMHELLHEVTRALRARTVPPRLGAVKAVSSG